MIISLKATIEFLMCYEIWFCMHQSKCLEKDEVELFSVNHAPADLLVWAAKKKNYKETTLRWPTGICRVDSVFFNHVFEKENVDLFLRNFRKKQK